MDILGNASYNTFTLFGARKERLAMEAEADLIKAQAMANIASQPADKPSPLLYLIPIAGILVIGGIIIYKKRKG